LIAAGGLPVAFGTSHLGLVHRAGICRGQVGTASYSNQILLYYSFILKEFVYGLLVMESIVPSGRISNLTWLCIHNRSKVSSVMRIRNL
jgi:hypothetical protein